MSPLRSTTLLLLLLLFLPSSSSEHLLSFSSSSPTWLPTSNLTLLSPNSTFAAGFLRTNSTPTLFTFSIWVRISNPITPVWSLRRPVNRTSPLTISPSGLLSLRDPRGFDLFNLTANATNLTLSNSGGLLYGAWSSSSSPTDTILPNHIIPNGTTLRSGPYRLVNASVLQFNATDQYWNCTRLVKLTTDGHLMMHGKDPEESVMTYDKGEDRLRRLVLERDGNLRIYSLHNNTSGWVLSWVAIHEPCTIHGTCGEGAICVPTGPGSSSPGCRCPPGYRTGAGGNPVHGCTIKIRKWVQPKFLRMDFVEYDQPDGLADNLTPLDFDACRSRCLENATCAAFAYKLDGSRMCVHRPRPLLNGFWSPRTHTTTYLKVAGKEADVSNYTGMTAVVDTVCAARIDLELPPEEGGDTARNVGIVGGIFAVELLAGLTAFWAFLRRYSRYREMARTFGWEMMPVAGPRRFGYAELKGATHNFSQVVGSGGFGVVYKGELPDRRSIAVKKLRNVDGGEAEFWAEVTIIARMHHLNLVRLWGFCAEKKQRMLVYEYVPNGALNKHLFNLDGPILDWNIRYRIAVGVARAIAYLHEECFEWVLHSDIKPDNILLTHDFCPKVSDFGLAKLANKEEKVKVSTIRGTRGYMAPEWVMRSEPITAKADVYSFGMVLLNLVSGKRHLEFSRESLQSEDCYFPSWAFEKVFEEGTLEEVMDQRIADGYDAGVHLELVDRMVKTAMWCIQDRAEMRPSMGKVVKMLEGTVEITQPRKITLSFGGEKSASSGLIVSPGNQEDAMP